MAARKKAKPHLKKQKTVVSLSRTKAGKSKKPKNKGSTKPAKASKPGKSAKKKLTASAKKPKKKISAKTSPKLKKQVKSKKKLVAPKKPSQKRPLSRSKTVKTIKTKGERLHSLKKILLAKRENILQEAKEELARHISGENRQLVDTALDDGDWAVVDTSEDLNLMRLTMHRKTLLEIDEALRKIAEGTYGICEECGDEISEKRLRILPSASLCINCKEDKERFEAIEKEDLR